jgi:hypothetical protein
MSFGALVSTPLSAAQEASHPLSADALAHIKFKAIKVDVSPLIENGSGPTASWIEQDLRGPLQAAFAGRLAPGDARAPTLVVRIDEVFLGPSNGAGAGMGLFGGEARDNIQGAGVIVGLDGRAIVSYPLLSTLTPFTGGPAHDMGTERGRIADLASSFAHWLPGQMGL